MRRSLEKFLLLFLLFAAVSCSENRNSKSEVNFPIKPLIMPGDNGDDWGEGDFAISITNISENDSGKEYKAISQYKNEEIGLAIFVPNSKGGNKGFGSGITLKSIGKRSDRLLSLLAMLYKQKLLADSKFIDSVTVEYVDLDGFAKSVDNNFVNKDSNSKDYKLFFESKDDEAELYLNIKPKEHLIEIKEKDQEYRPAIIQMLKISTL